MRISPRIVEREATPYAAIAAEVVMPFEEAAGPLMGEAAAYLSGLGSGELGPAVFRYTVVAMPRLEMEFGFLVDAPVAGNGRVRPGVLPAGRYVTTTYFGHYDDLEGVTGELVRWARAEEIEWDSTPGPDGERFVSRFELYPNGPMDEPDPAKWETQIWFKMRG